jgi:hypothetical protein
VRFWGLWGAALSTVAALAIVNIGQLFPIAKLLGVPFSRVLPWRGIAKVMLCTLAALPLAAACVLALPSPVVCLLVSFLTFMLAYVTLAMIFGLITVNSISCLLEEASKRIPWLAALYPKTS